MTQRDTGVPSLGPVTTAPGPMSPQPITIGKGSFGRIVKSCTHDTVCKCDVYKKFMCTHARLECITELITLLQLKDLPTIVNVDFCEEAGKFMYRMKQYSKTLARLHDTKKFDIRCMKQMLYDVVFALA